MLKYLQPKYLLLYSLCFFSISLAHLYLTKDKIGPATELIEIKGTLSSYSFEDGTGRSGRGREYYIALDEYSNWFQISAEYVRHFRSTVFRANTREGDKVVLTILPSEAKKLNSDEKVFVYSIKANKTTFLSLNDVIKMEEDPLELYIALIIFILGFIIFFVYDWIAKLTG
jgi:hypothetical protein